jgi:hypothetical protein
MLCVRTNENRIAFLKLTRVIKYAGYDADVIVWEAGA